MFYSFIKLPEGKMSTRRGNVVFMDDLLEEAQAHAVEVLKERRPDLNEAAMTNIAEAVGTLSRPIQHHQRQSGKGVHVPMGGCVKFQRGPHRSSCTATHEPAPFEAGANAWRRNKAGGHRRSRSSHHAGDLVSCCGRWRFTMTVSRKWFANIDPTCSPNTCSTLPRPTTRSIETAASSAKARSTPSTTPFLELARAHSRLAWKG